jgi:hypothetical protein
LIVPLRITLAPSLPACSAPVLSSSALWSTPISKKRSKGDGKKNRADPSAQRDSRKTPHPYFRGV